MNALCEMDYHLEQEARCENNRNGYGRKPVTATLESICHAVDAKCLKMRTQPLAPANGGRYPAIGQRLVCAWDEVVVAQIR